MKRIQVKEGIARCAAGWFLSLPYADAAADVETAVAAAATAAAGVIIAAAVAAVAAD